MLCETLCILLLTSYICLCPLNNFNRKGKINFCFFDHKLLISLSDFPIHLTIRKKKKKGKKSRLLAFRSCILERHFLPSVCGEHSFLILSALCTNLSSRLHLRKPKKCVLLSFVSLFVQNVNFVYSLSLII